MIYAGHKWFQAGHSFENGVRCACGRYWLDIRNTEKTEIGKLGIAHSGILSENEWTQIDIRKKREEAAERDAMGVAGRPGSSPVTAFVPVHWSRPATFFTWFVVDGEDPDEQIPF